MREEGYLNLNYILLRLFFFFFCLHFSGSSPVEALDSPVLTKSKGNTLLPSGSPSEEPQPFLPFLAPSPLTPFMNKSIPRLSGLCTLNFSAAESMMSTAAVDCWDFFAPFLANVICCPQLEATLAILVGQSSKSTGALALDNIQAKNCLSDVEQMLVGRGASNDLKKICSIHLSNLTEASCPVKDVRDFENIVDSSKLLAACGKIDPVNECCSQICQSAISEAAKSIAMKDYGISSTDAANVLPEQSSRVDDCKIIVLRWLSSRLDPVSAKKLLRGLSNCNVNKVCPLVFPDTKGVSKDCGNGISNRTACCNAMENYVSHLQKQSFITNLQALDCASLLGMKLHKYNITRNVYGLCQITLKDFSLQVGLQESGCLLPSLPSDATFDNSSGISFVCDLNDNIAAPWPSTTLLPTSSCNQRIKIPALPAATSAQSGSYGENLVFPLIFSSILALTSIL